MIHTVKTHNALSYSVVWFPQASDAAQVRRSRAAVTVVRQGSADFLSQLQGNLVRSRRFCTAGADLSLSEAALWQRLNRTSRHDVRHGLAIEHDFALGAPSELPDGRRLIDDFLQRKFGRPVSAANWRLTETHGCLSQITYRGEVIAAHSYLLDGACRARAWYGATAARLDAPHDKHTLRYLSRALLWRDMLHFKALGVALFDVGGLFDDPNHPSYGIDQYKLSFGMQKFYEYHALLSPYAPVRQSLRTLKVRL